jgi:hypothetical protein
MHVSAADFLSLQILHRRHLTTSQRVVIGLALQPMLAAAAKKRMAEAGRKSSPGRPAEKVTSKEATFQNRDRGVNGEIAKYMHAASISPAGALVEAPWAA